MKKILTIFTLFLALAAPMHAQVFMVEDHNDPDRDGTVLDTYGDVIYHASQHDQINFAPLGQGLAVMTALGACYLLGKRMKSNRK